MKAKDKRQRLKACLIRINWMSLIQFQILMLKIIFRKKGTLKYLKIVWTVYHLCPFNYKTNLNNRFSKINMNKASLKSIWRNNFDNLEIQTFFRFHIRKKRCKMIKFRFRKIQIFQKCLKSQSYHLYLRVDHLFLE